MANEFTIDYTKFEPKKLTFTQMTENTRSKGQLIAFPEYPNNGADNGVYIQSPWIKLYTYGVPRLGEYYKTDSDRSHLRVPFDLSHEEIVKYVDIHKEMDKILSSDELKETLFGPKKAKKYTYQPIIREGQDKLEDSDSDEETNKNKKPAAPRPPYMKIKLDTTYPEGNVKSSVFESIMNPDTNKRVRTKVEGIVTIDDFAEKVRYLSNIRYIAKLVKVWAHPLTKKDPQYGVVFKLVKIEVEPAPKSASSMYKQIYESDNFIDSDTDNLPSIAKMKLDKSTESDESSDEITKPVIADSDESDSEIEVVTTKTTSKIVEVSSDSDDSENEEPEPEPEPVKVKAVTKKAPVTKSKK